MILIKNKEKFKNIIKTVLFSTMMVSAFTLLCRYSKECSAGIVNGITLCLTVLIPSLFLFMICADFLSNCNFIAKLCNIFEKPMQKTFKLPSICASVLLLSVAGGYPVGASATASLYKSKTINNNDAEMLGLIAVCSGPGFVINYLGCSLLKNKQAGVIIFASQVFSFFLTAFIVTRLKKAPKRYTQTVLKESNPDIVKSVQNSIKSTANMCGMVIAFCAITNVCNSIFKHAPLLNDIINALLEVTSACNILSTKYPLYVISFVISFGGLSVHFQVFSILKDIKINKVLFFLIRILQSIISATTTYILLILFPVTKEVFSTTDKVNPSYSTTIFGSAMLVLTAVCFLNSLNNTKILRR